MPDILIHHCRLSIVRSGGWGWGTESGTLAREAVAALRVLLERQLAELWPEGAAFEVVAPVRIVIPVQIAELKATTDDAFDDSQASRLHERFRAVVERSIAHAVTAHTVARAEMPQPHGTPASRPAEPDEGPREKLLRLLATWRQRGELESILALLGEDIIEAWHRTLLTVRAARPPGSVPSTLDSEMAMGPAINSQGSVVPMFGAELGALALPLSAPTKRPDTRVGVLRARIVAAVEAGYSESSSHGAVGPAIVASLDRTFPVPARAIEHSLRPTSVGSRQSLDPESKPIDAKQADAPGTGVIVRRRLEKSTHDHCPTASALPFLLLGALSRIGYFDALDVFLTAAESSDDASLFATAFAYKALSAPERGWRRSAADVSSAAVFAGLEEPASNAALVEFSRRAIEFAPALDRVVTDSLARGHVEGQPLLLCEVAGGDWLLAEVEGTFPVARSNSWDALLGTVERFGRPLLLVPARSVGGGLLTRLNDEGVRFVTDAVPTRGEPWRRVHRLPHERWCTNDTETPDGQIVASARKLASAHECLQTTWDELSIRPCVAPGDGGALETSLMLSMSVALADLSWRLWKDMGDTDPLLAMERFGNFEARIQFRPDAVLVKLPLGKRSLDLSRHRLLDDVASVPWFGGKVVRFSGG
jgi:hypothetical protein